MVKYSTQSWAFEKPKDAFEHFPGWEDYWSKHPLPDSLQDDEYLWWDTFAMFLYGYFPDTDYYFEPAPGCLYVHQLGD